MKTQIPIIDLSPQDIANILKRVCQQCSYTKSTWEYPFNAGRLIQKLRKLLGA